MVHSQNGRIIDQIRHGLQTTPDQMLRTILKTYKKIGDLLDARERRMAVFLFGMIVGMGLLEAIGVASIMPFVAVVANPQVVESNRWLAAIYDGLGFTSTDAFLVFLGIGFFVLVVGSLAFKALTQWAMAHFSFMRTYTLSSRLLRGYLNRPYSFFLDRHSADLGKTVLDEAGQVIGRALMPAIELLAGAIVALFLILLVVIVSPVVAISAAILLGGAYGLIYAMLRRYIGRIGTERVKMNKARYHIAQEAMGGIKDIKVLGLEDGYMSSFQAAASRFSRVQAYDRVIGQIPRFFLEALLMGGMLVVLITLLETNEGELSAVLPLIALYAFAGARVMPALQRVYMSLTGLRFGIPALDAFHRELVATEQIGVSAHTRVKSPRPEPIHLNQAILLDRVWYTYPNAEQPALKDLTLTIPARTTVGLVGATGAGKTTVADIILGLLDPQQGYLKVDDQPITGTTVRTWQRNIGYVSQSIFLSDDTVANNIAFGISAEEVDHAAVERAARIADLHNFVLNEMPDGYATHVGERGVRLSGGQRQRIGIARALYHDPEVLVLDEATSSLDNLTEKAVMDAVHNLGHRKTIILIAHRLSTIRKCDQILFLREGRLIAQGDYEELIRKNRSFQLMAAQ